MEFLKMFVDTYAQFFNGQMWLDIFTNPTNWGLIATLILMEGLLSADNAIALSVQVRHLPGAQRKKALMYGLWGAYVFRFIAIGMGTALTKLWWVKLLGGAYLFWMMISFFIKLVQKRKAMAELGEDASEEEIESTFNKTGLLVRMFGVFWATVFSVEMMDIAFSVDSVLAAFGISDMVGILLLGGMLGILMMRGVAQVFTKLIEKIPELEVTAYVIVGFIGLKMLLSTVHEIVAFAGITMHEIHITHLQFFIFLALTFAVTFLVHFKKNRNAVN
ncbi:hypothetical protein ACFVS2_25295 [Brevibacillus sp. NPDC058079]|uniref:TerC family protein n=1 Tax=Brevibacillus sp. NPDC058079 TaxID=3346330 RepID=UPI0036F04FC2